MAYENIRIESPTRSVFSTIDRPKALNALNPDTLRETCGAARHSGRGSAPCARRHRRGRQGLRRRRRHRCDERDGVIEAKEFGAAAASA